MASVHGFARDREALKVAVERAVAINPLNADMVALSAIFLSLAGEHDRAAALVRQAAERKPQHPGWYHYPMFHYYFDRGEYDAALREIKSVNMPKMPLANLAAAAISGHLGRATEAKAAFAGLRAINPGLAEPAGAQGVLVGVAVERRLHREAARRLQAREGTRRRTFWRTFGRAFRAHVRTIVRLRFCRSPI